MSQLRTPYLLLLGVGICWASTPVWVRGAALSVTSVVVARALLSGLGLMACRYPSNGGLRLKSWRATVTVGITACLSTSTFAAACYFTKSGNVYLFYYTFPVILFAYDAFKESIQPTLKHIAALTTAGVGLLLAVHDELRISHLGYGEVLAAISALTWATHVICARKLRSDAENMTAIVFGQLIVGGLGFPFIATEILSCTVSQGGILLGFGASSVLALLCWSHAVRYVEGNNSRDTSLFSKQLYNYINWLHI